VIARPFDYAAAVERLGPVAVEAAHRIAAAAPPLSAEQRAQIRAVFVSARTAKRRQVPAA
jgi:hypothetical protein